MDQPLVARHSAPEGTLGPLLTRLEVGTEVDWPVQHLGPSAWFEHIPFAFWLVRSMRPRTLVELGTHWGASYFAFCQAIERLTIPARCYAVDTWKGDPHAGEYGEDVFQAVHAANEANYRAFSSLLRMTFNEALQCFSDSDIDLLHIDGLHTYEAVSGDFQNWRPKLSSRAVVIFHDTEVREHDFGVWRLWNELKRDYPHFEFHHGFGLGVLGVGQEVPPALQELFALSEEAEAAAQFRAFFSARGAAIRTSWLLADANRSVWSLTNDLQNAREQQANTITALKHEVDHARSALADAQRRAAIAEAERIQQEETAKQLRTALDQAMQRANALSAEHIQHELAAKQLRDALERASQREWNLSTERDEMAAKAARLESERALLVHGRSALEAARAKAEAMTSALLSSTSWRVTRPLRGAIRLIRREPGAIFELRRRTDQIARRVGLGAVLDARRQGHQAAAVQPSQIPFLEHAEALAQPSLAYAQSYNLPISEPAPADTSSQTAHALRIAWIGTEAHTPGYRYRVLRWADAARTAGAEVEHMRLDEVPYRLNEIRNSHTVIIWRAAWDENVRIAAEAARESGARLIFDVDDLMFDPEFASVKVIDGIRSQSLSEEAVRDWYCRVQATMLHADICTATTEELASHFRRFGKPALVLPNGYDSQTLSWSRIAHRRRVNERSDGYLRIGYAGGTRTHQRDFAACADAVARVLRERADTKLVLFRDRASGSPLLDVEEFAALRTVAEQQIEWRDEVVLQQLPDEIARFDVNLAPLEVGNPFSEAKSELKYFEAALAGVCTVASPTGPYQRAIRNEETGLLANTSDEWYVAISRLLDDHELRARMSRAALHDVLWTFGPERRAELMATAIDQFRGGRAAARAFELELHRSTNCSNSRAPIPASDVAFESDTLRPSDVTVIIPLYNYETFVVEALESVAAQTLKDIDLVVVDDASTDKSLEVAVNWVKKNAVRFNRAVVLRNVENSKLGPTRNVGFDAAETRYVLPLDADNRLLPQCLEACLAAARGVAAVYAYPIIRQFGDMSHLMGYQRFDPVRFVGGNFVDAMALIAKSAWCLVGGYHNVRYGWEDYDFWCRIAEKGLLGVAVGGEPLAEYRVHNASMLRTETELDEHKKRLIEDIERRHPWVSIAHRKSHIATPPLTKDSQRPERLARIVPLLRCPETRERLELVNDTELRSVDTKRTWSIIAGRPVLFPGMQTPETKPQEHVSNPLPDSILDRMRSAPGLVLNLSAGGTTECPDNVIEAEASIFRNTDIVADAHALPFIDECFEGVVAMNAFEHYHDPRQVALEIMRLLKPGGWVLIRTAFLQPQHEAPWHFYNCTKYGLMRWFDGFETEYLRVTDNFNPAFALSWIASEAESALRRDLSAATADTFCRLSMKELVALWREPSARASHPVWADFQRLSQESQESIAAGFEYVGRRPIA